MNTDSLIQDEIETQNSKSAQKDPNYLEMVETDEIDELMNVETVSAEEVDLSQEVFDESCNEKSSMIPSNDEIDERLEEYDHLAEAIPETVLKEAIEEMTNTTTSEVVCESWPDEVAGNKTEVDRNVIDQVGQLTRNLHNSLRELGYDKRLESLASEVPEAQDKLSYVASKTEQAAERTLNATEVAMPIQEKLSTEATQLSEKWKNAFEEQRVQPDTEKFKQLLIDTLSYLDKVPAQADATNAQLMEIMMAQDFQDLTGQVIKKITTMVHRLEQDLLQLLLANVPPEKRYPQPVDSASLMNGPVTNPEKQPDTVSSQDQVDDLLASLGF